MIRILFTVPNGRGLGHNARQRAVVRELVKLLDEKGEEYRIGIATEAKVTDFWKGFEIYKLTSPHNKKGKELKRVILENGEEIYRIIQNFEPDLVIIDNIPRRLPKKVNTEKILFLRPYGYEGYAKDHGEDEKSWGGFPNILIPTHEKYERLEDIDPKWEEKKESAKIWKHVGRIIPFKEELEKAKKSANKGEHVLLAYGGGGLLHFGEGEHIIELLESSDRNFKLLAGPYASKDFVEYLKKFPNLKIVEGYLKPLEYARELAKAKVVVNPFGYNTQTMCFYLGVPVVSYLIEKARDKCRLNWARKLEEINATRVAYNGREIAELIEEVAKKGTNGRELVKMDGAEIAAKEIYSLIQK